MIAMRSTNSVALAFSKFDFFEVESSCFSSLFSQYILWKDLAVVQFLWNGGWFKLSFCCTYAPTETEFEHVAETTHKLLLEMNGIKFVTQHFHTVFFQWITNVREAQIGCNYLEWGLQRENGRKVDNFHTGLRELKVDSACSIEAAIITVKMITQLIITLLTTWLKYKHTN